MKKQLIIPTDTTLAYRSNTADLGVKYPSPHKIQEQGLSVEECHELFGVSESVKMNFIPQMMGALAFDQAAELVYYCREHKVKELRRHTRVIQLTIEQYAEVLRKHYGEKMFRAYMDYFAMYRRRCAVHLQLMRFQADTLAKNQKPHAKHYDILVNTLIVAMLIEACVIYDANMDKLIAAKTGLPVKHRKDEYQGAVLAMCISIGEDLGYKIEPNGNMGQWVQILMNHANNLADELIAEQAQPA